jgi:hypothetical protein
LWWVYYELTSYNSKTRKCIHHTRQQAPEITSHLQHNKLSLRWSYVRLIPLHSQD